MWNKLYTKVIEYFRSYVHTIILLYIYIWIYKQHLCASTNIQNLVSYLLGRFMYVFVAVAKWIRKAQHSVCVCLLYMNSGNLTALYYIAVLVCEIEFQVVALLSICQIHSVCANSLYTNEYTKQNLYKYVYLTLGI